MTAVAAAARARTENKHGGARRGGGAGIGGSPPIDGNLPTPPPIPQRRAAIGAIQELSEDDVKFLEFAFVHDSYTGATSDEKSEASWFGVKAAV